MASILVKRLNISFLRSSYGLVNSTFNSALKPNSLNLTNSFSTINENVMPAHQEIVENRSESEKLFTKETVNLVNSQIEKNEEGRLFAVVHVAGKQFKVTAEDIIIVHAHWPPKPGDEILFEKVLLVGGKDFTLIGRPVLPSGLVSIKGTIIDKDLSHTKTHFVKVRRKQYQRINFIRNEHTMVRINEIKITAKVGESKDSEALSRTKPET